VQQRARRHGYAGIRGKSGNLESVTDRISGILLGSNPSLSGLLATLRANTAFDRDRMDIQHAELGKQAVAAPVSAVIALLLATIGQYAVMAHGISQRTKEIGVRVALGATADDIRRLIFREGMQPVVLGSLAGLTMSLAVNRILQSQLVGVSPYDPVTLATTSAALILAALLACQLPSQRALRIDPAVALRHD
jgi:ABC-type antimicrobial peptide transport system permease subunit